jgi:hypothetical protein
MTNDEEPIDAIGPWTIKSVSVETRNKVTIAARKEGLTIGQWLERRVAEWLEDGGPVRVSKGQPGNGKELVPVSRGQPDRPDLSQLRELVTMARELSPADKDTSLLRDARRAVRNRLRAMISVEPPG